MAPASDEPVLELRVALTTSDYSRLVEFYCTGLGIDPEQVWQSGGGHGLMLDMGHGSLEIFDQEYARYVDQVETEADTSSRLRIALRVPDLAAAVERLLEHGAILVHPPAVTPWGDLNARLRDPDGLQVTLFQVAQD